MFLVNSNGHFDKQLNYERRDIVAPFFFAQRKQMFAFSHVNCGSLATNLFCVQVTMPQVSLESLRRHSAEVVSVSQHFRAGVRGTTRASEMTERQVRL